MTTLPPRTTGVAPTVWRDPPSWSGMRTAALGPLSCRDPQEGARLLGETVASLRREGFEAVIGPMQGDTWHPYRYVTESDGSPAFLMEPSEDPIALAAYESAGFGIIETYSSSRVPLSGSKEPAAMDGVSVTPWDGSDPERFLADVHALSCEAFSRNPFYKPLDRAGFDRLYKPMIPLFDRRLILFARDGADELLGFVFGFPQPDMPGTCVLKTYASRRRGVGRLLADAFDHAAAAAGFTQVIHALMHDGNESRDRSERLGAVRFRRYALLGRRL